MKTRSFLSGLSPKCFLSWVFVVSCLLMACRSREASPVLVSKVQVMTGTMQMALAFAPKAPSNASPILYFRTGGKRYELVSSKDTKMVGDTADATGFVHAGGNYRVTGVIDSGRILVQGLEYLGPPSPALSKLWDPNQPPDLATVKEALAAGVDVNADDNSGGTLLHHAANAEVARFLITAGANINARDDDGLTPLFDAVRYERKDVAEVLLAYQADVNAKDVNGNTPLVWALSQDDDMAEWLLARGADVNAKTKEGATPLHLMAKNSLTPGTKLLLAHGADLNAKDNNGQTPLHYAAAEGSVGVAKLLLAKGADVNARDNQGETPLRVTSSYLEDVAELLRQHSGHK